MCICAHSTALSQSVCAKRSISNVISCLLIGSSAWVKLNLNYKTIQGYPCKIDWQLAICNEETKPFSYNAINRYIVCSRINNLLATCEVESSHFWYIPTASCRKWSVYLTWFTNIFTSISYSQHNFHIYDSEELSYINNHILFWMLF